MSNLKTFYRGWEIVASETSVSARSGDEEFTARGFSDQKRAMDFGKRAIDRRLNTQEGEK